MMVSVVSATRTGGNFIFLGHLDANFIQKWQKCQICVIYENLVCNYKWSTFRSCSKSNCCSSTKMRKGNIFSHVCLSVPMWPLPMMHWTSPYRDLGLAPSPQTCSNLFNVDLTVQSPPPPRPRTCSNLIIMKHVRLTSGQLTSYFNDFLFKFVLWINFQLEFW